MNARLAFALVVSVAAACECEPVAPDLPGPDAGPPDPNAVGLDFRPANLTCRAVDRPVFNSAVAVEEPWPNLVLRSPLFITQEPGTNFMWAIERAGRVVRWPKDDAAVVDPELVGDIQDRVQTDDVGGDERGLLGLAFHPDYPGVPAVYLSYTGVDGDGVLMDRVSRYTVTSGDIVVGGETVVIEQDSFAGNHNGGMIAFSPTDPCRTCLYYGTGDGGGANDVQESGQDTERLLGKMLRLDVAQAPGYAVPADNPFVGVDGFAPEIYALGLRNPWRWSFDRDNGDLWLGDVGQGLLEEIDFIERGGNYGWNVFEGTGCFDDSNGDCALGGFEEPITEYPHEAGGRNTIVGGYMYRGAVMPDLVGTYFYADFRTGEVLSMTWDGVVAGEPQVVLDLDVSIASFGEDADGELYVVDHVTGGVRRIVPAGAPIPDTFPQLLSQTGCADPADATRFASGMIPYGTAHSLYSDGAAKARALAVPDGVTAFYADDGDIDFPGGTVMRKDFRIDGKLIETRLLMKHDDGDWGGYSFEWNEEQTDATLVAPGGRRRELEGQTWTYPSRNGCMVCHTIAARRTLGLEIAQLNVGFVYPGERFANQLKTLEHIGIIPALPGPIETLPALVPADDAQAPVEQVARAYMHVNCSNCHRPGGFGVENTDWRFNTPFAQMALCNAEPTEGDLGVAGARRLVPGDPARSLVSIRMKREDRTRMPQLGVSVIDELGVSVIDGWIASLTACP